MTAETGSAPFDPRVILADLGVRGVAHVERVHGGMDTAIWRVESDGGRFALRLMRPEQVETSRLEVAAMQAARAAGVRTPQLIALESWQGRPAMLLEWLPGSAFIGALEAHPLRVWSLGVQFGRMQAAIHTTTAPSELCQEESSWIGWARDERIGECLRRLSLKTTALLHFDYHPLVATAWRRGYEQVGDKLHDLAPFFAWAGMAMVHDLSPRVANPDHWFEARHLDHIRRWAQHWKERAGIRD